MQEQLAQEEYLAQYQNQEMFMNQQFENMTEEQQQQILYQQQMYNNQQQEYYEQYQNQEGMPVQAEQM